MSVPQAADPLPFPTIAERVSLLLLAAGVMLGACGLQLLALVLPNALSPTPPMLLLSGVALIPTGMRVGHARAGAAGLGAGLAGLGVLVTTTLAGWLWTQGVFSLLLVLTPIVSFIATISSILARPTLGRFEADQARIAAELGSGGAMFSGPPGGAAPWISALAASVPAAGAGLIGLATLAPLSFERLTLRAELLLSGRWPGAMVVEQPTEFPYAESPFVQYATYEVRFVELDVDAIRSFADGIADEVGWRLLLHTGAHDLVEAERQLWERGEAELLPVWIARSLRDRGVFYHRESLLSRSFDPWLHSGKGEAHLDCDLLAHLFAHVASRLDLDLAEIPSPLHAYVVYRAPAGLVETQGAPREIYVETTNFRKIDAAGQRVDFLGEGLGDDFFIDADYHRSGRGGVRASPSLIEAGRLYEPADSRQLEDMIIANVLVGIGDLGVQAPIREELQERLPGTTSYLIVTNLYGLLLRDASAALASGDTVAARADAEAARAVREGFPKLMIEGEPRDRVVFTQAAMAAGDTAVALAGLDQLSTWYATFSASERATTAYTGPHAETLLLEAALLGTPDLEACERTLGAVIRFGGRYREVPWQDRLCELLRLNPACAPLLPESGCG